MARNRVELTKLEAVKPFTGIHGSVKQKVSEEEWRLRVDLAGLYRIIAHFHWDDLVFTHISCRLPGNERHFLINPYGLLFNEVAASNLVRIDQEGYKVDDSPYPVNPAGFAIHSAIHRARADAHCVLHLHTNDGMAVAAQAQGLLPITQNAMVMDADLAYHDFAGAGMHENEGLNIARDLGSKHTMILRNHGTLCVGATCADAFMRAYTLERACSVQIRALAGGALPCYAPADMAQKMAAQILPSFAGALGKLVWPAILRKLDRLDPTYRE
ncbi:MAG: class II aldolase/adducin family protein [Pseudomonadota bacterium]|nr:class II aldolase/adducin family protein [Pseudomonadota bacterium]